MLDKECALMELEFEKRTCRYLDQVLRDTRTEEQTQEVRIGEGMPDVGRVIGAWGQVILRSKEWRGDWVMVSGGVMAWVLYAPEDGTEARCVDTWLPFKMKWDIPEGLREGDIRVSCLLRMVDGRGISPRKIITRAVVSVRTEVLCPAEVEVCMPCGNQPGVEVLRRTYPMQLYMEAGEKTFLADEELVMNGSGPKPEKIYFSRLSPRILERKVLTDKLVLRGNGNLRLLGKGDDGQVHTWDFDIPFSQIAQLRGEYGPDALAEIVMGITSLEPELDGQQRIRIKCGLVAQYLVSDREMLEIAEDAYSPARAVALQTGILALPSVLDNRMEQLHGEQKLPLEGGRVVDCDFLPEHPRRRRTDTETILEFPGILQVLCYGENGELTASNVHWEKELVLAVDSDAWVEGDVQAPDRITVNQGEEGLQMHVRIPVNLVTTARNEMNQITKLTLGEEMAPDPGRPSLILRRAGRDDLWQMAKDSGSTVEAIRQANDLREEPEPGRMLLIPVS